MWSTAPFSWVYCDNSFQLESNYGVSLYTSQILISIILHFFNVVYNTIFMRLLWQFISIRIKLWSFFEHIKSCFQLSCTFLMWSTKPFSWDYCDNSFQLESNYGVSLYISQILISIILHFFNVVYNTIFMRLLWQFISIKIKLRSFSLNFTNLDFHNHALF